MKYDRLAQRLFYKQQKYDQINYITVDQVRK